MNYLLITLNFSNIDNVNVQYLQYFHCYQPLYINVVLVFLPFFSPYVFFFGLLYCQVMLIVKCAVRYCIRTSFFFMILKFFICYVEKMEERIKHSGFN